MYNVLLVDDERIAVDTLYEILQELDSQSISIFKAYSGTDAIKWFEKTRIDIVITDVCMPDINGMELQNIIKGRWPRCKVIFLSGYDRFDYAREAMRNDGVDYIIKTDKNEVIFDAIKRALVLIQQEEMNFKLIADAQREYTESLPILQKELILELLGGEQFDLDILKLRFNELDIHLDIETPILILLGHVDNWEGKSNAQKKLDVCKIHNIVKEYLKEFFLQVAVADYMGQPIWLLQPKDVTDAEICDDTIWDKSIITLQNTLDIIQNSCSHLVNARISFVFNCRPCFWQNMTKKYDDLKAMFFNMSSGSGKDMILNDGILGPQDKNGQNENFEIARFSIRQLLKLVPQIENYLENNQPKDFEALITEIIGNICENQHIQPGLSMEMYYTIALTFQTIINKMDISQEAAKLIDLGKLMRMELHASWTEIGNYFRELASVIFASRVSGANERTQIIVVEIKKYIKNNLAKDLSIVTLAEIVHLNQSYLSRLFKQATGTSISDYIIDVKIEKAKELLSKNKLKVYEVSSILGFSSHACFTRFFRRYTKTSPQDYKSE